MMAGEGGVGGKGGSKKKRLAKPDIKNYIK